MDREARTEAAWVIDKHLDVRPSWSPGKPLPAFFSGAWLCFYVMRNADLLKNDLVEGILPEYLRDPVASRVWQGILHCYAMGYGVNSAALYEHDFVAFKLSEAMSYPVGYSVEDASCQEHALRILADAVDNGHFG